jgi:molybdenum cofactor cytidylyltransferase
MNHQHVPGLGIVVLAAGFSSRLGRSKALATVRGVSLVRRTVAVLSLAGATDIVVVTPPRAHRVQSALRGYRVTLLANSARARGLSSSVQRGLRATRHLKATLLLPADLGELTARDLMRLIARWRAAPRRIVARRLGSRAATPLIVPKWLYGRARELKGDVGLRDLVEHLPAPQRSLVDLRSAHRDVDTAFDLAAARRARGAFVSARGSLRCI